jgi:hypothetical protein
MHGARISIWFFIGVLLIVYGAMIAASGVSEWVTGNYAPGVELVRLHMPVWWGILLGALGLFYGVKFRPRKSGGAHDHDDARQGPAAKTKTPFPR